MNIHRSRKYISTAVAFSFVAVGLTGVCFQFFFKNHFLEEIHGWLGVVMVAAAIVHTVLNWKALRGYLRDWRVYISLVPVALIVVFLMFGQESANKGMNPREVFTKLSQASAEDLAHTFGKDVDDVFDLMTSNGIQTGGKDESVQQLAERNQEQPQALLSYFIK